MSRTAPGPVLQGIIDRDVVEHPQIPGRLLRVEAPANHLEWEGAAGLADVASGEPLLPGACFRIASVTKPFTGAAALRLAEEGQIGLDNSLERYLPIEYAGLLRSGGYETAEMTVRHLLTHTSGIYDFAASTYDPAIVDGFDAAVASNPTRRWTRFEQVEFAVEHGTPYGRPGEVYAYSDTGAVLVGEIIERVTGLALGAAFRELLGFERFGLRHTFFETLDPEPPDLPPRAHQYEGDLDVATIDPSVDLYGGGGLVSTCHDLAIFFRTLLRDEIFTRTSTLETMLTLSRDVPALELSPTAMVFLEDDPTAAGMYIYMKEIGGETCWGHGGWWGVSTFTCPRLDITVATAWNQAHMPRGYDPTEIIGRVIELIREG